MKRCKAYGATPLEVGGALRLRLEALFNGQQAGLAWGRWERHGDAEKRRRGETGIRRQMGYYSASLAILTGVGLQR